MLQNRDRDVVAELPTGVGKSAAAGAVAVAEGSAYLVSPQTSHVDQMTASFRFLQPGQASSSHLCLSGGLAMTCRDTRDGQDAYCDNCPYVRQRDSWLQGPVSCSTLDYLYMRTKHPDKSKRPECRARVIVDEAHALERSLVNYEGFSVSDSAARVLRIVLPIHPATEAAEVRHPAIMGWVSGILLPAQTTRMTALDLQIAQATHELAQANELPKSQKRSAGIVAPAMFR
jgi:hypothetical protein